MIAPKLPTGRPQARDHRTVRHVRLKVGKHLKRRLRADKNRARHTNNGCN